MHCVNCEQVIEKPFKVRTSVQPVSTKKNARGNVVNFNQNSTLNFCEPLCYVSFIRYDNSTVWQSWSSFSSWYDADLLSIKKAEFDRMQE